MRNNVAVLITLVALTFPIAGCSDTGEAPASSSCSTPTDTAAVTGSQTPTGSVWTGIQHCRTQIGDEGAEAESTIEVTIGEIAATRTMVSIRGVTIGTEHKYQCTRVDLIALVTDSIGGDPLFNIKEPVKCTSEEGLPVYLKAGGEGALLFGSMASVDVDLYSVPPDVFYESDDPEKFYSHCTFDVEK